MLSYVIIFFLLTVIASLLGFKGLAGTFASIAKILAFVFLVLFVLSLFKHLLLF